MSRKYMTPKEFLDDGYLQELNRRMLHPLGLALEVVVEDDGSVKLGGIWDYRDDPEGIAFAEGVLDLEKFERIEAIEAQRFDARVKALGWWAQPVGKEP